MISLATQWRQSPTLAEADARDFERSIAPIWSGWRDDDPEPDREPDDMEDSEAMRQVTAWQAQGVTPQQACRLLGEIESRLWAVVMAHLKRQSRDKKYG